MTCLIRRSSPVDDVDAAVRHASVTWTPFLVACSRTIDDAALERVLRARTARARSSHLARLDLGEVEDVVDEREQVVARGEDVLEVLLLLRVDLAEQPLAQHLREADDRVQRRAQLVRHVRQELRLVLAGGLELPVEALELVVHPVDVGRQRAELVAVRDVDVPREVRRRRWRPAGSRSAGSARSATTRARTRAAARGRSPRPPTPMKRFRELVYALAFWAIRASVSRRRRVRELGGVLVEVDREQLGPAREATSLARRGGVDLDDLSHHLGELAARRSDPAQEASRPRAEAGSRGCRGTSRPGSARRRSRSPGRSPGRPRCESSVVQVREDRVEVTADVLRRAACERARRRSRSLP